MTLEDAVNERLGAASALQALTTDIQPGHSERNTNPTRWVRWEVESGEILRTLDEGKKNVESVVIFDVYARNTDTTFGYTDARDIAAEVIAAVEDQRGAFGGTTVKSVTIDDDGDGPSEEVGTYHRVVETTWSWLRS